MRIRWDEMQDRQNYQKLFRKLEYSQTNKKDPLVSPFKLFTNSRTLFNSPHSLSLSSNSSFR